MKKINKNKTDELKAFIKACPNLEDILDLTGETAVCSNCGENFFIPLRTSKSRKVSKSPKFRFCSKQCFRAFRLKVYVKYNERCHRCGSTENLQMHHIKPLSKNGSYTLDNLELLCEECHKEEHGIGGLLNDG